MDYTSIVLLFSKFFLPFEVGSLSLLANRGYLRSKPRQVKDSVEYIKSTIAEEFEYTVCVDTSPYKTFRTTAKEYFYASVS